MNFCFPVKETYETASYFNYFSLPALFARLFKNLTHNLEIYKINRFLKQTVAERSAGQIPAAEGTSFKPTGSPLKWRKNLEALMHYQLQVILPICEDPIIEIFFASAASLNS